MKAQTSLLFVPLHTSYVGSNYGRQQSFKGVKDLIAKEQFINSCPKELAVHLRERAPETSDKMAKIPDQYLEAHGRHLFGPGRKSAPTNKSDENTEPFVEGGTQMQCYWCGSRGHRAVTCSTQTAKRCYSCGKQGQEARSCRSNVSKSATQSNASKPGPKRQLSAGCLVQKPPLQASSEEISSLALKMTSCFWRAVRKFLYYAVRVSNLWC